MKKLLLIYTFIFALGLVQAQERFFFSNPTIDGFTVDIQENVYLWHDATLEKYSNDKLDYTYSNPAYGAISYVDAKIPSKILVFFQESGIILLLDNTLSPIGNALHLYDHDLYTITLAALVSTNHIVLFDNNSKELLITDLSLNIINKSSCNFIPDFKPSAIAINLDKDILLTDTQQGLYFFDQFGSFVKKIQLTGLQTLDFWDNNIFYLKDSSIYKYDPIALDNILLTNNLSNVKSFKRVGKSLYYLDFSGNIYRNNILR